VARAAPLILLAAAACSGDSAPSRPDVVLISLDSVRADFLTFLDPETAPNLCELAQRGTIFGQAISGTSWTLPSHLQMFTGMPPVLHGVQEDDIRLDPELPTLPELLRSGGYQTAGFYTCWYLSGDYGFARGFERYTNSMQGGDVLERALREALESEESLDRRRQAFQSWKPTNQFVNSPVVVDGASEILDEVEEDEPLFLFAHFFDPHFDYIPPPPFGTRFDPDYAGSITGVDYWTNPRIFDATKSPPRQVSDRDLEHLRSLYRGEVAWTDDAIGRLLDHLEDRGRLDETLIIVTADHGEEFFEHGDRGHRRTLFDEVLRVPLLVVPPRGSAPAPPDRLAQQVSLSDLLPTVLDYAGLEPSELAHGRSLRPALEGVELESRPLVSSLVIPMKDPARGVGRGLYDCLRTPTQKLIRLWSQFEGDPRPRLVSVELYDLVEDPGELSARRTLEDRQVRQAWVALEREMDEIRRLWGRIERTPASRLGTEAQEIFSADLAHLGYAAVGEAPPGERDERIGYEPLPPAGLAGPQRDP